MKTKKKGRSVKERFWNKVKITKCCWLYTGYLNQDGYGRLWINDHYENAHRISWLIHFGKIPKEMLVLHKCDNPRCVRPKHLFLGSQKDNMRDMITKGRSLVGEINPSNKLTEIEVIEIRRLVSVGKFSQRKLAEKYSVNQTLISAIVTRKIWKHV